MELFKEVKQIYTFCKRQELNFEKVIDFNNRRVSDQNGH